MWGETSGRVDPAMARLRARFLLMFVIPWVMTALICVAPAILNDGDTFWHLATGRWILDHRQVPHTDPFSYTFVGRPWVAHEWLAEVVMALVFQASGWSGIMLLTGLAMGGAALVMAGWLRRWMSPLSTIATLVIGLACVAPSLLARPHILALPALALWTVALLDARARNKAPNPLWLALMVLWANLHSSFIFGLGLAGAFALEAALDYAHWRWRVLTGWAVFTVGAVAAALITPHGLDGLTFPLKVMSMKALPGITEWAGPNFLKLEPIEIALLAGVFAVFWRGVRLGAVRAALVLLLVHLTLQHVRQEVLLGVVAPLLLGEPLGRALGLPPPATTPAPALPLPQIALISGLWVALLTLRLGFPETRIDSPTAPITALAHVPPDLAREPVLNAYDFGGYLIFRGVRPYIDGRADMYGDAFVADHAQIMAASQTAMDRAIQHYTIRWAILAPGQPLVAALDRAPGWRRLYADRFAVVQEKVTP